MSVSKRPTVLFCFDQLSTPYSHKTTQRSTWHARVPSLHEFYKVCDSLLDHLQTKTPRRREGCWSKHLARLNTWILSFLAWEKFAQLLLRVQMCVSEFIASRKISRESLQPNTKTSVTLSTKRRCKFTMLFNDENTAIRSRSRSVCVLLLLLFSGFSGYTYW